MSNWLILIIAGLCETAFAACLGKAKNSNGQMANLWYALFVVFLIASMVLLIKAVKTIPLGTAYAVWTGIGAVGTAVVGILLFNESSDWLRILFICTLVASIVGLKYVSH
ncbi:MAG TPA: multidrug efflux SMR transporter [Bacteroidia bacterium]